MKKLLAVLLVFILCLIFAFAEETETAEEPEEASAPEWVAAESMEIPEDVLALFERAMEAELNTEEETGDETEEAPEEEDYSTRYEPLGLLGEADGVYCILCLARPGDPESAPWHTMVYVSETGIQNTWSLWLEDHAGAGSEHEATEETPITYSTLVSDLMKLVLAEKSVDLDMQTLNDEFSAAIAERWNNTYRSDSYALNIHGAYDPADLPITGSHAFVVLGLELVDGEMQEELIGRCEAAAAAARAFPDSIMVLSGGATGENNPDAHTEAGMMKAYLTEQCGIDAARIFTDERALTTVGNAVNTYVILREQGIGSITLVTSGYHMPRAVLLYDILGLINKSVLGSTPEIIGNYCFDTAAPEGTEEDDPIIAASQLQMILDTFSGADETVQYILTFGGEF